MKTSIAILFLFGTAFFSLHAQETDTSKLEEYSVVAADSILKTSVKRHSPTKAVIYAALVPGLGQAYNRKYWKMPIVYAGIAGLTFGIVRSAQQHRCYRDAYRLQVDDDPLTVGSCNDFSNASTLRDLRDIYKRRLDLLIVGTALWHAISILDAAVDAHLFEFNLNDDLTMSIMPDVSLSLNTLDYNTGVKIIISL